MSTGSTYHESESAGFSRKLFLSMIIPAILVILILLVKITEMVFGSGIPQLGILPLHAEGIPGIFLSPFIHEDMSHLLNNSVPLFFLSTALFYFYPGIAPVIMLLTWLSTGLLVWLGGRDAWHIGASGIVYGLASFLFFSGIIRKHFRLIALSLLIVFLYGEMVWGIFPGLNLNISWESHMLGFFSGIALAVIYRKQGPQAPVPEWIDEEEEDEEYQQANGDSEEITAGGNPPSK